MSPWLKAGIISVVIILIPNLLGITPFLMRIPLPLTLIAYIVIGGLTAPYIPHKRKTCTSAN